MLIWIWNKIKEEKFILLFLALLSMLRAAHEISKFRWQMSWLPRWDYPFGLMNPPLDSYHFFGGLFVLILIAGLRLNLRAVTSKTVVNRKDKNGDYIGISEIAIKKGQFKNTWWETILIIVVQYLFYFWVFDLFYHGLFMKPEFMQWGYIIPLLKFIQGIF